MGRRPQFLKYGSSQKTCIEEFPTRIDGFRLPEGVAEWVTLLRSVSANQIEWAFEWLPLDEVIHMAAAESYLLLMGLQSIQPYAPCRVLRQLGRYQVIPKEEDLSSQVIEIGPSGQFPEAFVRRIWNECQTLKLDTCVRDRAKGEVSPKYLPWYRRELEHQRPTKRAHIQDFEESSHAQWGWLKREEGYRAEIGKLKQQVERLVFENNVQIASERVEKNKLAREKQILKARIRQASKSNIDRQKRRSDERLIASLRNQVIQSQEKLEQSEACVAKIGRAHV